MPAVIPVFTGIAAAIGMTGTQLAIGLLATAARIGLSYYQAEKAKDAAKRSRASRDVQQNIKQGTFPRYNVLGKAKVGGVLFFYEEADGYLYIGTILADDIIDGVDAYYINEKQVLVDSGGKVTSPPFVKSGVKYVETELRYGYTDQSASNLLQDGFPGIVTTAHTLNGIAYLVVKCKGPSTTDDFQTVYNSQVPTVGAVVRGVLAFDPRDSSQNVKKSDTWKTTTNPALLLLYYCTATNGMGLSRSLFDSDSFSRVADYCDELIPTKTKGKRRRYEMGGVYSYDSDPVDVMQDILRTFDGDIYINSLGLFALTCDELETPEITITEDMVIEISVSGLPGALYEYSTIKTRYTSEDHGWKENGEEADPWVDESIKVAIGREIPYSFDLPYVFRHDQARRLMKRQLFRLNPEWSIDVSLDYNGLELFGERVCRFVYAPLGIDGTFRIESVQPDDSDGLAKISAKLTSIDRSAFSWDPDNEEGTAPAVPDPTSDDGTPNTPTNLQVLVGNDGGIQALLTWSASTAGHTQKARYMNTTTSSAWTTVSVSPADRSALITGLTNGDDYDFQVWVVDATYGESAKATISFTATATSGAIGSVSSLAAEGGTRAINASAAQAASATAAWVQFVAVPTGNPVSWTGATLVPARSGTAVSVTFDADPGTLDVYARAKSINGAFGTAAGR